MQLISSDGTNFETNKENMTGTNIYINPK